MSTQVDVSSSLPPSRVAVEPDELFSVLVADHPIFSCRTHRVHGPTRFHSLCEETSTLISEFLDAKVNTKNLLQVIFGILWMSMRCSNKLYHWLRLILPKKLRLLARAHTHVAAWLRSATIETAVFTKWQPTCWKNTTQFQFNRSYIPSSTGIVQQPVYT